MRINESLKRRAIWHKDWTLISVTWGRKHLKYCFKWMRWRSDKHHHTWMNIWDWGIYDCVQGGQWRMV